MTEEVRDPAALLAAYNKLKSDLAERVKELDTYKAQVAELEKKAEALNSDEFRVKALTAEAKLALQGLGIKDERALKLLGTDGLDFGEDGSVTGIKERVSELKKEWPEIFDPKVRAGGKGDIFADSTAEVKQDPLRAAVHQALSA